MRFKALLTCTILFVGCSGSVSEYDGQQGGHANQGGAGAPGTTSTNTQSVSGGASGTTTANGGSNGVASDGICDLPAYPTTCQGWDSIPSGADFKCDNITIVGTWSVYDPDCPSAVDYDCTHVCGSGLCDASAIESPANGEELVMQMCGNDGICEPPTYSSKCDEVPEVVLGFEAHCYGSTIVADWHVHMYDDDCPYGEPFPYQCTYDCSYGCDDSNVPSGSASGSDLVTTMCISN